MIALPQAAGLWHLISGPIIWASHFLLVYAVAAIFCAKLAGEGDFQSLRLFIGVATAVALAAIAITAWRALSYWLNADASEPHSEKEAIEEPRRFVARATLMLCGLSAVATLYTALPALFIESCR